MRIDGLEIVDLAEIIGVLLAMDLVARIIKAMNKLTGSHK